MLRSQMKRTQVVTRSLRNSGVKVIRDLGIARDLIFETSISFVVVSAAVDRIKQIKNKVNQDHL
jgi:hypothetical protein